MKHVDHVGIAVADLDEARKLWDALLGQTPVLEDVPAQKVRTATYPCGIELVAPTSPESPIARFLGKRGPGIHHVTLAVDDLKAHLARLKAQFLQLLPTPLLTPDQVELLRSDNIVSQAAQAEGRTIQALGIEPTALEAVVPSYLWRFRKTGQFRGRVA